MWYLITGNRAGNDEAEQYVVQGSDVDQGIKGFAAMVNEDESAAAVSERALEFDLDYGVEIVSVFESGAEIRRYDAHQDKAVAA